ncbi:type II toxin-antitoxin system RelE/ParE family toxin [Paracoccus marinaquae]|uniref:Toxin n=1 Tax=Paracoccus marinaquae TaxID=2841926 RepID=A0ABS6AP83_9RHOB|nr:type II toxin-antitoxin system RelE/ParE family toxin [Paracoccus marinaquae]MBU3032415.1 type II toxin-antitoxin system RelE/ParE family toxin [Paracoccus marinaquae]
MNRVTFSPAAISDLNDIWDYTATEWGPDQADRYTDDIQDTCCSLARGEKRGRTVDVRDGYIKYAVGRHFVFFRTNGAEIVVIRILHQSMDVARHL